MSEPIKYAASDDYASVWWEGWELYYGYEVTDGGGADETGDGEWCFQVKRPGKPTVTFPRSTLQQAVSVRPHDWANPETYLLIGIALMLRNEPAVREVRLLPRLPETTPLP